MRKWILPGLTLILSLLATSPLWAAPERAEPCDPTTGCADVSLSPGTLVADFYVGDALAASGANAARLTVPPRTTVRVEARNVRENVPGFGDVYRYEDAGVGVTLAAGQTRLYTLYPRKVFVKGFLDFTCGIRNVNEGENVACRVLVDGAPQPDLPPGGRATYNLEPGAHALRVELAGPQATLWSPAASEQSVNIRAGSTRTLRSTFDKKGLLTIALNQPGVVGDLYVDGELVASQTASAQMWVAPGATHRVEGRSFSDPAAGGVYRWRDATTTTFLSAGQERTATLSLQKEFLMGFADLRCDVVNFQTGKDVRCGVVIDGKDAGTIEPGARSQFTLSPGEHTLAVNLIGTDALQWELSTSLKPNIRAGQTTYLAARFQARRPASENSVTILYIRVRGLEQEEEKDSDEFVAISNRTGSPINLRGWRLVPSGTQAQFTFPDYVLPPYATVQVFTNVDRPNSFSFQWHRQLWKNEGGTASLYDPTGALVSRYAYGNEAGTQ